MASDGRHYYTITGNYITAPAATIFCATGNPGNIIGSTPSDGSGVYTYQWQTSTDSVNFTTVSGVSSIDFAPTQISQTTWYRRLVTSGSDTATSISNIVVITISQPVTNNTITAPAVITFNAPSVPGVVAGNTPSGGSTYTYQWQISTDDLNFTDLSGATGKDLANPPLLNQTTYLHRVVTSGACTTPVISNTVKIIVEIPVTGNTIVAPSVTGFCLTGDPDVITGGTLSGGNGTYSYQWQSSTDSIHFTTIEGANSTNFDPPPVSQTTWYRRLAFSGPPGAASATVDANSLDFFLIGGQSNAFGTGRLSLQTPIPAGICWEYVKGAFVPVTNQAINTGNTGSMWAAFAVAYYNRTGRKVCLVPASVVSSSQVASIDDGSGNWDVTGNLVANAVLLLNKGVAAAQNAGWTTQVKGVLWDQGERDSNNITLGNITIGMYREALQNLIANFRTRIANNSLPFYIFRVANSTTGGLQVQATQEAIGKSDPNTMVVFRDANDFTEANGFLNPVNPVHYTQAGYNLAGQIGGDNGGAYTVPVFSNVIKINISNQEIPVLVDTLIQINSGNPATLAVASPNSNNEYNWYDSLDTTTVVFSGPTFITSPITANKTYFVQAVNGACGISPIVAARVSIINGLDSLRLSTGTLNPIFRTGIFSYNASVDNSVTSFTLTPVINDPAATIAVNGSPVETGTSSADIPLVVGPNPVNITVTAVDGTIKTYTLVVTRKLSANANLSDFQLYSGTISPAFAANATSYTASVGYDVSGVKLSVTADDANATIAVNGISMMTGAGSIDIPLSFGQNSVAVTVTAADGLTTKTYALLITRAGASVNARLADLTLSTGTLTPVFVTTKTSYAASVINSITSITVTPISSDNTATISVNNIPVISGMPSTAIPLNIGPNIINITGTAQDKTTTLTYTLTVNRAVAANANLVALHLSAGTLSPIFSTATTGYTTSVPNTMASITVIPIAADINAAIKINSVTVISNQASTPIPLNIGPNSISITVTAQNGTTEKTYSVVVSRLPSANAGLAGITLSNGVITPVFSTSKYSYTASVPYNVSSVKLTATGSDTTAMITVNGTQVQPGTASPDIPLSVGPNTIATTVTAQDGITIKTTTLLISRAAPSSNASLANLKISSGTLTPVFSAAKFPYTATVAYSVGSITITPTASDTTGNIKVNGLAVISGTASASVPLSIGQNVITITVVAQDGITAKTYTVAITRLAPSANAALYILRLGSAALSPLFAPATTAYSASVANSVASTTITLVTTDANATVTINGVPAKSGTASAPVPLNTGLNTITVTVTAQDGITVNTYTITVTRLASVNASLAGLTLSNGTLTPVFTATRFAYTALVPYAVNSIAVASTVADTTATIAVNGTPMQSGIPTAFMPLFVGANTVTAAVTAQDGITIKKYTIIVTRAAPSTNANLISLTLSNATLTPVFASGRVAYTAKVPFTISSLTLVPTAGDATATITVNGAAVPSGTAAPAIALSVGTNTVTTTVTAQDGITTKAYTAVITRAAPSANASLAGMVLNVGTLTPAFAPGRFAYTAAIAYTVASVNVTPTVSDATATITVNGLPVLSGMASAVVPLSIGSNTINIVVAAQDGITTKTYTVILTRAGPSENAGLASLALSTGTLTPVFATTKTSYASFVANNVTSIAFTPTVSDSTATVMVNNMPVKSGTSSTAIPLIVGPNIINVTTQAEDGVTTKTYAVTVTRVKSSNANLVSLQLSSGTLSPVFSATTTGYAASVANAVAVMTLTPATADTNATITINNIPVKSGLASAPVPLAVGSDTIVIKTTAQNGTTSKTYTLIITRAMPAANSIYVPVSVVDPFDNQQLSDLIKIHQAVSPNGDGINDFLMIDGITAYPDNKLTIMNKAGEVIFETIGYDNITTVFDGHSNKNGKKQQSGTYFYLLEYKVGDVAKRKSGFLILKW
ncbi:cadherin-like beta sandwich domain-containing protein [Mucilaginibacter gotjawali]|nr:cadherin-like beta sandwich domain-containing protein [Mucilaginibacter gotjawali]